MEEVDFLEDPDEDDPNENQPKSFKTYEPSQKDIQSTTSIMMRRRSSYGVGIPSYQAIQQQILES